MRKKIQDKSWGYSVVKPTVCFLLRIFYGKIQIEGRENIPEDKAIIFAPNHQNALMDALLILYAQPGRTVFLARADIFKQKVIARILTFLRILPVYRIRDGRDELDKNYAIFNQSVDVLRDGVPLCLMPEGRQSFKRQLLPLVKGMFRIAYQAQEVLPGKEVVIVPVGIDYTQYVHPFADVVVRFGQPVHVKEYLEIHEENPAKGLNLLRDEVSVRISSLIQDIRSKDHYYDFYGISKIEDNSVCESNNWKKTPLNMLLARKEITQRLDQLEAGDPEEAARVCNDYKAKYPDLDKHEKKGQEFTSSILFVVFLLLLLGLSIALIIVLICWLIP